MTRILPSMAAWAVAMGSPRAGAAAPNRHETEAERLHRKGVHCMDVLERKECAIENFEALLSVRSNERVLMSDAMVRLLVLYERAGDDEAMRRVLRRFWDVGMKRGAHGHVPHTVRYFPSELNMLINVDVQRIEGAPVLERLGKDPLEFLFTCSEARRADIRARWRWKRAVRRAKEEGKEPYEIIYAQMDAEREREKKTESKPRYDEDRDPIFAKVACPVAEALGQDDLLGWRRMTGAMNHHDFRTSIAIAEVPGLDARLAAAVQAGRLEPLSANRWVLPGIEHAGKPVHLAKLDHEELTVASPEMLDRVIEARRKRRRQINREVQKLIDEVPVDTGFFMVMNQAAMRELGFGGMKEIRRGFFEALLPKPKGFQLAAVFNQYVGLFTRVPTDNPVKAKMLLSLAQTLLDGQSGQDPKADKWLRNLDLAEARDGRALLATYLLSSTRIEELLLLDL